MCLFPDRVNIVVSKIHLSTHLSEYFMAQLFALRCPTCNANLQVAGDRNQFACEHCGTSYLLEQPVQEIKAPDRDHLSPLTTYTHNQQQWLRVGKYEIFIHTAFEEKTETQRLFFADVAYRNPSAETLSCRRSQWVLYDKEGYSYDAEGNNNLFTPKERAPLGGERFITPGTRVRGWVVFIVPKSAQIERLQFLTGHLSTKIAEFLLGK